MQRPVVFVLLALIGVLCGMPLCAQAEPAAFTYLQAQTLPPQLLPPPPQEGDAEWHRQVTQVIAAQRHTLVADIAAMRDEQRMRLDLLTSVMGENFTRDRLPKTFALLDHAYGDAVRVSEADKQFWHTRRPYLTDAHVKLRVDPIDASPAYPSGHTSESRVLAEILGLLAPDKLPALRARADAIAWHRVEAGVHYPTDVEAGKELAMLIVGALLGNEDFQDDLAEAKKEEQGTGKSE